MTTTPPKPRYSPHNPARKSLGQKPSTNQRPYDCLHKSVDGPDEGHQDDSHRALKRDKRKGDACDGGDNDLGSGKNYSFRDKWEGDACDGGDGDLGRLNFRDKWEGDAGHGGDGDLGSGRNLIIISRIFFFKVNKPSSTMSADVKNILKMLNILPQIRINNI
jgi:hypothetical protein